MQVDKTNVAEKNIVGLLDVRNSKMSRVPENYCLIILSPHLCVYRAGVNVTMSPEMIDQITDESRRSFMDDIRLSTAGFAGKCSMKATYYDCTEIIQVLGYMNRKFHRLY
jgi:hypothetical protein